MAKRKKGFQKKLPINKLNGKYFRGNFYQEICSEGFITYFMLKISKNPFSIDIWITNIVDDEETETDYEKYDYSERLLFYERYFDALVCSDVLSKEDLEDIKYLCQN